MQLSKNFTLEEAVFSQIGTRKGINNTPGSVQLENMKKCASSLELVRSLLKKPIIIDSWYRSAELNTAIGGVGHSAHMEGWAVDFVCPGFGTPIEVAKAIAKSKIKFDQIIYEGTWVHISFNPKLRGEQLTAQFTPGKATTYITGI
jgi:hypothetical protein